MYRFLYLVLFFALTQNTQANAQAVAPKSRDFVSWEPSIWHANQGYDTLKDDTMVELIADTEDPPVVRQGYRFIPFRSTEEFPGIGACTRTNWKNIRTAGVFLLDPHGGRSSFVVATSAIEQDLINWANDPGFPAIDPNHYTITQDGNYGGWVLMLKADYFLLGVGQGISAALTDNEAIVVLAMCKGWDSKPNDNSIASVIGGRAVLSYENSIFGNMIVDDLKKLFGYMSGVLPENPNNPLERGSRRILKDAYGDLPEASPCPEPTPENRGDFEYTWDCWEPNFGENPSGGYDCSEDPLQDECGGPKRPVRFRADGNLDTTIAPAVALDQNKKRRVSPEGDQGNIVSGSGFVVFDTVCNATAGDDASDVLVAEVIGNNDFRITNVKWASSSRIEFDWSIGCYIGEWEAKLRVKANKVTVPGSGVQLDGNENPAADNPGGIAPNRDDFVWALSGTNTP